MIEQQHFWANLWKWELLGVSLVCGNTCSSAKLHLRPQRCCYGVYPMTKFPCCLHSLGIAHLSLKSTSWFAIFWGSALGTCTVTSVVPLSMHVLRWLELRGDLGDFFGQFLAHVLPKCPTCVVAAALLTFALPCHKGADHGVQVHMNCGCLLTMGTIQCQQLLHASYVTLQSN